MGDSIADPSIRLLVDNPWDVRKWADAYPASTMVAARPAWTTEGFPSYSLKF
jgi:hypothetical protein